MKWKMDTASPKQNTKCCKVESVISIDDRGQMVLQRRFGTMLIFTLVTNSL